MAPEGAQDREEPEVLAEWVQPVDVVATAEPAGKVALPDRVVTAKEGDKELTGKMVHLVQPDEAQWVVLEATEVLVDAAELVDAEVLVAMAVRVVEATAGVAGTEVQVEMAEQEAVAGTAGPAVMAEQVDVEVQVEVVEQEAVEAMAGAVVTEELGETEAEVLAGKERVNQRS